MTVEIPREFAERIDRFGPHFIKVERAEPGVKRSGKSPVEKNWQLKPMKSDDSELLSWLDDGGNYGVVLTKPIYALDIDDKELLDHLHAHGLPRTFTVRSGSQRGFHPYLTGDLEENGEIIDSKGESVGHIQVKFKQVVGPNSVHNSGGTYDVVDDRELAWVTKEDLDEIFEKIEYTISWSHQKKISEESAGKETELVGDKIPIIEVLSIDGFEDKGFGRFQGSHPIHGSDGGQNFSIDTDKNCWHCFRHGTGGGPLSLMLVLNKEIECREAVPGKLRGNLFKRALELAKLAGFKVDDVKVPFTYEPTVPRVKGTTMDMVIKTVREEFPGLEPAVETMMSVAILNWFDLNKPFCLMLTGVSGSGKTTVMDMLEPFSEWTIRVDDITAASFVTQKSEKASSDELKSIDFLPMIEGKILITPEASPLFSASEETLRKMIGVLTRILDGAGYMRAAGTHGLRGYQKDVHFVWIGGTVPFSWRVWRAMAEAGPRMYFQGMPEIRPTPRQLTIARKKGSYKEKVLRCRVKVWNFLMDVAERGKIEWDVDGDSDEIMDIIGHFAILLTRLRGQVVVKTHKDGTYQHWSPRIELAYKPFHALYDVARGHAALYRRTSVNKTDLVHAANLALNSAPDDRVKQFRILLEAGTITNGLLADALNCSISSAQRTTRELLVLGLIERVGKRGTAGRPAKQFRLAAELEWFLGDEFAKIREELGIEIKPSGVFPAIKRGATVVTEGENPEPDPIVIETPSGENWLDEFRSDGQ